MRAHTQLLIWQARCKHQASHLRSKVTKTKMGAAMDQLYSLFLSLATLGYLGSFGYLMGYLRRVHFATWVELGQPEFTIGRTQDNPSQLWESLSVTLRYLFSNRHQRLGDPRLNALIWLTRVLLVLSLALFLGLFLGGSHRT
jgi:hypothetical protein